MLLVEVYQVMQSQEYGDTLFTEAVAGFTATGFNTCLRHCLLNLLQDSPQVEREDKSSCQRSLS